MNDIVTFLQTFTDQNSVLPSFFFLTTLLLVRWLGISFFFSLLYFIMNCTMNIKLIPKDARVNYYSRYALLLSFVLPNLGVNDYLVKLVFQLIYTGKPYASVVYLLVSFISASWLLIAVYKLVVNFIINRRVKKVLKHADNYKDSEELITKAKTALNLNKQIKVVTAGFVDTPVSYGILVKYVLFPVNYNERYSSDELYLMLLHELSHIKNGDTVKFRLINFTECFMWFNPIVKIFIKKFRQDTEILCDSRVMGIHDGTRKAYGDLLLKSCSTRNSFMGYGFSDSYRMIKDRINALYHYKPTKSGYNAIASVAALTIMVAAGTFHYAYADNLDLNINYNTEFEISLNTSDYSAYEFISPDIGRNIYKIENETIRIDKYALKELFDSFSGVGYEIIVISSKNFSYSTNQAVLTNGNKYRFKVEDVSNINEQDRYFSAQLSKRHPVEHLFLLIANKI